VYRRICLSEDVRFFTLSISLDTKHDLWAICFNHSVARMLRMGRRNIRTDRPQQFDKRAKDEQSSIHDTRAKLIGGDYLTARANVLRHETCRTWLRSSLVTVGRKNRIWLSIGCARALLFRLNKKFLENCDKRCFRHVLSGSNESGRIDPSGFPSRLSEASCFVHKWTEI